MYYVVTKTWSDKPGLTVLATCRTVRGLARRLETLLEAVGEAYRDNADGAVGNQLRAEGYEE